MDIQNSVALVTGSGRRIGRRTAVELARRGGHIAVHYRSSMLEAESALREIRAFGVDAELFCADLNSLSEVERLVAAVHCRFGRVDILVNNASVFGRATLDETTPEFWTSQMDANARAPFFLSQHAARLMKVAGRGKIVNLADPAGEFIWSAHLAYSISKSALLGITRGLAKTLAPEIQVNAVAPGPVLFPEDYSADQKRVAVERTLLKRAGSPDDVVRAIVFLIENDYITGEVIHVDGGRHVL